MDPLRKGILVEEQ